MPYSGLLPWVLTSIVASVASAVTGAHSGLPLLSWAAVLIFAGVLIATALETNRPWWELGHATPDVAASALEINTALLILAYTWGGIIMFAVYRLSGLRWQHGWQYAAGMGLIALALQVYAWRLAHSHSRLRHPRALAVAAQLSVLQALAAVTGVSFLLFSGMIASVKGDWAANQIFLAGGLAVALLSAICAYTQFRFMRNGPRIDRTGGNAGGQPHTPPGSMAEIGHS